MALSGTTLLALYLTVMAALIGGFFILRKKFRREDGVDGAAAGAGVARRPAGGAAAGGPPRARGAMDRMRRGGAGAGVAHEGADDDEAGSGSDVDDGPIDPKDKKAMRKAEKAAARAARADMRAQQEAQDSHKKAKEDKYAAKREAREAEREREEKEAALAAAQKAEEQRKKDDAEFDEWKDMFTVSGSGTSAEAENDSADLLEEFIATIKKRKVVVLDELAAQFHMKTPDVITRIQQLEADGRLTGVLDDRGKFLYITPEELDSVARWINKRGRVNITDLVAESNKLIDLNGTNEEENQQLVIEEGEEGEQK